MRKPNKEKPNKTKELICVRIAKMGVGFIEVGPKDNLSTVRAIISGTFDDVQKEMLTASFNFLYNGFIISKRQEEKLIPVEFLKLSRRLTSDGKRPHRILEVRPKMKDLDLAKLTYSTEDKSDNEMSSLIHEPYVSPNLSNKNIGGVHFSNEPEHKEDMHLELPPTVLSRAHDRKHLKIKASSSDSFTVSNLSGEKRTRRSRLDSNRCRKRMTLIGYPYGSKATSLEYIESIDQSATEPFWLDIQAASHLEIERIGKVFGVHPLTVEDISLRDSREKLEIFSQYLLVIFYSEHFIMQRDAVENPISLLLFSNFIISFHNDEEKSIEHLISKITKLETISIRSPSWVCYAILDSVVDDLIPVADKVLNEIILVEEIGHTFGAEDHNEFLARVSKTRRNITMLRQRLWPKQNMLSNMISKTYRNFLRDVSLPYFRDCQEHISKMINSLEIQHENLNNIQSMFLAKVSLEVAESSHKLDNVAKRFGSFATIMLPLTFVTGLLGMNVTVPFQTSIADRDPHAIAFYVVLLVMVICGAGASFILRKKGLM
ncbi:CorA metal ion transporter [Bonamia ostreae]|uniref:CorA metal ion transporter n=1 Tax=Bonamia ostreae TaxID=126728 RepID=A0ABV2AGM2_9EUKA